MFACCHADSTYRNEAQSSEFTLCHYIVVTGHWVKTYTSSSVRIEQGRIFRDLRLPGVSAAERAALYVAAVETLAKLHSLDLASLNLDGYGKGSGYCKRQVSMTLRTRLAKEHLEL